MHRPHLRRPVVVVVREPQHSTDHEFAAMVAWAFIVAMVLTAWVTQ